MAGWRLIRTAVQSFREPTWFAAEPAQAALAEERSSRYADEFRSLINKAVARIVAGGGRV